MLNLYLVFLNTNRLKLVQALLAYPVYKKKTITFRSIWIQEKVFFFLTKIKKKLKIFFKLALKTVQQKTPLN